MHIYCLYRAGHVYVCASLFYDTELAVNIDLTRSTGLSYVPIYYYQDTQKPCLHCRR